LEILRISSLVVNCYKIISMNAVTSTLASTFLAIANLVSPDRPLPERGAIAAIVKNVATEDKPALVSLFARLHAAVVAEVQSEDQSQPKEAFPLDRLLSTETSKVRVLSGEAQWYIVQSTIAGIGEVKIVMRFPDSRTRHVDGLEEVSLNVTPGKDISSLRITPTSPEWGRVKQWLDKQILGFPD
jgi:hypothetical protein